MATKIVVTLIICKESNYFLCNCFVKPACISLVFSEGALVASSFFLHDGSAANSKLSADSRLQPTRELIPRLFSFQRFADIRLLHFYDELPGVQ